MHSHSSTFAGFFFFCKFDEKDDEEEKVFKMKLCSILSWNEIVENKGLYKKSQQNPRIRKKISKKSHPQHTSSWHGMAYTLTLIMVVFLRFAKQF